MAAGVDAFGAPSVGLTRGGLRRGLKSGPWSIMSATKRGHLLRAIGDGIARNADRLAEIETRDNGKIWPR